MKHEQLLNRTLDVLTNAYLNKTLEQGNCAACAVGNIVAAASENTISRVNGILRWDDNVVGPTLWFQEVWKHRGLCTPYLLPSAIRSTPYDRRYIQEVTGYTIAQLSDIEDAFERGALKSKSDQQYAGLQAVYEALLEIHFVDDVTEVKECIFATSKPASVPVTIVEAFVEDQDLVLA